MEKIDQSAARNNAVPTIGRIQLALTWLRSVTARKGLTLAVERPESVLLFSKMPAQKQEYFLRSLEAYIPIIQEQIESDDFDLDISIDDEVKCLEAVKEGYNLQFSNRVYDNLVRGDVIEIYNSEGIQIYRNLNFFKTTNYSLLDILSHPWPVLWDRSSLVQGELETMVSKVMASQGWEPMSCGVSSHLIKERAFGMTQTLLAEPRITAKIMSSNAPFGFLFTVKATPLSDGDEAAKISFV